MYRTIIGGHFGDDERLNNMSKANPLESPDFIHVQSIEAAPESLNLLTFPGGLRCYTHTSIEESELIFNEIFVHREYLQHGVTLRDCRLIIDVGANIGLFTVLVGRENPKALIHAFEPIDDTYKVLTTNIKLHGLETVCAHCVALGANDRTQRTLTYYPNMAGNSTASPTVKGPLKQSMVELIGQERTEMFFRNEQRIVTARTLSSILDENGIQQVDLLKIDVEGDEVAVLQGITTEHFDTIRQVVVETHTESLLTEATSILELMGFQVVVDAGISASSGVRVVYATRK